MTITIPPNLPRRTLRAAAAFGLSTDRPARDHAERTARLSHAARELLARLRPGGGGVALLTGPSGSGKSTLLRALDGVTVNPARLGREPRPVAQLSRLPLAGWLKHLCAFGLAEAPLLLTPAQHLSAGQQFRLALALAAARVVDTGGSGVPPVLLCDEFCSLLDRTTALAIAASIRRWVSRNPHTHFIAATAHDDLETALQPDLILSLDEDTITLATRA